MEAIVLVDPVTEWRGVIAAAKPMNVKIVSVNLSTVTEKLLKFVPTKEVLEVAGVDHVIDMKSNQRDVYACVRALKILAEAESLNIVGTIPLSETAVEFVDIIASMLGIEFHNPMNSIHCRRDKGFMKDAVAQKGLPIAKYARIYSDDDMLQRIQSLALQFPVVVKTPQGFSTTDVFICKTIEDAKQALDSIVGSQSPDGRCDTDHALLEEYITGDEFAVNTMSFQGGKHTIVTDVWKYAKEDNATYSSAEICDPSDSEFQVIVEYAKSVANAVGIRYGAGHIELKAIRNETRGQYVRPMLIEVGARMSGGSKSSMAQQAAEGSWDPFTALLRSHCGIEAPDETIIIPKLFVRHIFLPIVSSGIIRDIQMPNIPKLGTYHSHAILVRKGDKVDKTNDIVSFAGFVWLVGQRDEVDHDTAIIRDTFVISVDVP